MNKPFRGWFWGVALGAWAFTALASQDITSVAGQRFRYCHNPVWVPFDYNEQGVHRGIFHDYISLLAQRMGVELEVHPTDSWTEALQALQRGECDLLVGAVKTPEREQAMLFTAPYYNVDYVVVAQQDKPYISSLNSLSGQSISGPKNAALLGFIARDYPAIKIVPMETAEQQIEAVATGQVYAGIGALDELAIDKHIALNNFKIIYKLEYPYPISIAVRKDQPQLHQAFEAAVQSITQEDRLQITRRWTPLSITQKVDYTQMLKGFAVALLVVGLFVVWNRRLQAEVRRRRQAEATLTQRSQQLEKITQRLQISLRAGRLGTWEWFSGGRISWPEDTWLSVLGYEPAQLPQHIDGFLGLVHPEDVDKVREGLNDCIMKRSDFFEVEFRLRAHNGAWRRLRSGGIALARDANGEATHIAGVHFDFTAQRQAQDAKQAFVSMVSHELRTPLNAIIGLGQRLAKTPLEPQQQGYLQKIDKASRLLLRVVNDILDFSQLESGKFTILPVPFVLHEMLGRVMDIVRDATDAKGLQLQLQVAPEVPQFLIGDGLRLEQVLINLASNAAKFTDQGKVSIEVTVRSLQNSDLELQCSVRDTGIGMKPEELERVFEPFTQIAPFLTRRQGGTGLGLPISQQLIEMMGGQLWASSTPGEGSCFSFFVPLQIATAAEANAQELAPVLEPAPPVSLRDRKVLLVEDSAFIQQFVTELLCDAGMQVQTAANGLEALSLLEKCTPDLVLMDIQMELMDGLEASRLIRAMPGLESLPILAMTAHSMPEMMAEIQGAGFTDFLLKPVEPKQLYSALQRALETKSTVQ
ncbi:MAG: transporter substrate-binding domain-containing protein [Burkholderiaceae bacterium]|nr:transporter substrate-binding domain-containing protein [Burkholderiaceae bacterium]MCD8517766.1 transporter substrate-binding domain-containing protein [Burkholderiaceae bacterium]MCD8537446.1 transporter substrate-binding domain-containing protein [Burkholderiaceae bacterium]MCD8564224.1 transporter substrate-binding domain-containing protein [Burkholderiaceae bacterium]